MKSKEFAQAIGIEPRTVYRWLRRWHELGVPGIMRDPEDVNRREDTRAFILFDDLLGRYQRGELPCPCKSQLGQRGRQVAPVVGK